MCARVFVARVWLWRLRLEWSSCARVRVLMFVRGQAEKAHYRFRGLDLINGKIIDNAAAGVLEPAMSKVCM